MKKITIIGGDNRLKMVKKALIKEGYSVDTLGLYEDDFANISTSEVILFPVPTTKDSKTVFTPLTDKKISLEEIANQISSEQLVLCCNYNFQNKKCIDYGALDSYALLNAVPTAEGAIKIAIENTPFCLWQSKILVIGYGRVGKILADRLKSLGANVTVSARKPSDFAMLSALGFSFIHTEQLNQTELSFDIIFSTVDVTVLEDRAIKDSSATLLVDLSSKGGFNLEAAKSFGKKALKAPGLPGIIAPKTAADILCNTITTVINTYN